MNVMTNFSEKKREKQLYNERKLLRDLSIEEVKKSMIIHFNKMRIGIGPLDEGVEEACFDVAIEAYLNGGEFSRFTIHGENIDMAKKRCHQDITHFIDTLYYFWLYLDFGKKMISDEDTFIACEHFVDYWWVNGYRKGERRYKLRLH
ncbi:YbaK family protein [Lederbergia panacisoli]|uniref:YbaK family protein n=1 Tax=Lederbergia panacisoli TaxID=1255251 RepID=UPI00214C67A5|nr:YbaK family protein [Lederbergia panacisoli]MCR2823728.1 YbaK family protein [Lederbergia panacisoli]